MRTDRVTAMEAFFQNESLFAMVLTHLTGAHSTPVLLTIVLVCEPWNKRVRDKMHWRDRRTMFYEWERCFDGFEDQGQFTRCRAWRFLQPRDQYGQLIDGAYGLARYGTSYITWSFDQRYGRVWDYRHSLHFYRCWWCAKRRVVERQLAQMALRQARRQEKRQQFRYMRGRKRVAELEAKRFWECADSDSVRSQTDSESEDAIQYGYKYLYHWRLADSYE